MRRTVDEAFLLECAHEIQAYNNQVSAELEKVHHELAALHDRWEGAAVDAFLQCVSEWKKWSEEMSVDISIVAHNAQTTYGNYIDNARVNTEMWGG
ncbi:WXG100 family type VII secretion target [Gordonia sp. X0973]|uniref:WXG100 family type VII secretion target n=1 Tax=Gordonia sp. X0973 TaxID=2742602 RepID=UPI0013ECD8C8|nr:WXG100 family type VII secretion target [Gordonia sp. X0973]QKT06010.1 WXG100 family type VII secretion target [Gordonia sp. X0973]